jgi:hypothetical protein
MYGKVEDACFGRGAGRGEVLLEKGSVQQLARLRTAMELCEQG